MFGRWQETLARLVTCWIPTNMNWLRSERHTVRIMNQTNSGVSLVPTNRLGVVRAQNRALTPPNEHFQGPLGSISTTSNMPMILFFLTLRPTLFSHQAFPPTRALAHAPPETQAEQQQPPR